MSRLFINAHIDRAFSLVETIADRLKHIEGNTRSLPAIERRLGVIEDRVVELEVERRNTHPCGCVVDEAAKQNALVDALNAEARLREHAARVAEEQRKALDAMAERERLEDDIRRPRGL